MKRLTLKDKNGWYLTGDGIYSDWGVPEKFRGEDIDRLADIEDILGDEYDLDRLRELAQADREGRVVVLPCDPGQVVWAANSFGVSSHKIRMLVRDKDGDFACSMIKFPLEDFGRKVFLTRAEAQAALRREQE